MSAEEIASAPTTHIGDWVKAQHVDVPKNFDRPDREAGLDALDTGFPGIPRADLMALPDADWRRLEDRLTYTAWAAKTKTAEAEAAAKASNR